MKKYLPYWSFLVLAVLAYFVWQNVLELRAEEPRRAVISMEMHWSGDWLTPTVHDTPYYNKPPLFNWAMASCFKLFGSVNEWIVRLPSILAFFSSALFIFIYLKKRESFSLALIAGIALLTSVDVLFYGSINSGEIDLFFSLIILLQLWSIYHYEQAEKYWNLFLVSYALCALAFLTKGPPAIAFQTLTLIGYLIIVKKTKLLFRLPHFCGVGVFILIAGSYFALYESQNGTASEYLRNLIFEAGEKIQATKSIGNRISTFLVFPIQFLKLSLPWSLGIVLLLFPKLRILWKWTPLAKFACLAILVNMPLYWFGAKFVARYLYPLLPFMAILSAHMLLAVAKAYPRAMRRIIRLVLLVVGLSLISLFFLINDEMKGYIALVEVKIAITVILLGVLFVFLKNTKTHQFLILGSALLIARLLFNMLYLPYMDRELEYRESSQKLIEMSDKKPILIGGELTKRSIRSLGPIAASSVEIPPQIPYQYVYYIGKAQNSPMSYSQVIEGTNSYLVYDQIEIPDTHELKFEFRDEWQGRDVRLYTFANDK